MNYIQNRILKSLEETAMTSSAIIALAAALAVALSTIAPAIAQGLTASKAMEAIARQPESTSDIRANMIIIAALVEGVALFAVIVCLLCLFL